MKQTDYLMVDDDPIKYDRIRQYSILDYFTYVEIVSANMAKKNNGKSPHKV